MLRLMETVEPTMFARGGHADPSIWTVIKSFQTDRAMGMNTVHEIENGQPPTIRIKSNIATHQQRLSNICNDLGNGLTTI